MIIPLTFRFFYVFLFLSLASNFPIPGFGFFWGLISIFFISIWVGKTWRWEDSPFFLGFKTFFFGAFTVSLVDVVRLYYLAEEKGVSSYLSTLKWSVGLSLVSLLLASLVLAFNQALMHGFYALDVRIRAWILKEKRIYEKTWVHRKIFFMRKKVRGFFWRIRNKIK